MNTLPTYAFIRANWERLTMIAPSGHVRRLADKHEDAYRRWRGSKRPPDRRHLRGALLAARALNSLARARGE